MVEAGPHAGPAHLLHRVHPLRRRQPGPRHASRASTTRGKHLRRLKALGAFTVKSYMQPRREQRQWILQAAREERMMVVPEGGGDLEMRHDDDPRRPHHDRARAAVAPLRKDVVTLFGRERHRLHADAAGGLRRHLGRPVVPPALRPVEGRRGCTRFVPPGVVDTLGRIRSVMADRRGLAPPRRGAPRPRTSMRRGRPRVPGRPRPDAGPGPALGAVGLRPGRHDPARRRCAWARSTRRRRSGLDATWARSSRASSPTSWCSTKNPLERDREHGDRGAGGQERPRLHAEGAGAARQAAASAAK